MHHLDDDDDDDDDVLDVDEDDEDGDADEDSGGVNLMCLRWHLYLTNSSNYQFFCRG